MRAALALIAALALTACQVNVEGAPCTIPGTATDCPDGQGCGADKKCSKGVLVCPDGATGEIAVDPSNTRPALRPTGVADPKECRFTRLGDALGVAAAYGGAATVKVYGTGSVVFGTAATGEAYPLDVAANVTLVAATGASDTTIRGEGSSAATMLTVRGTVDGIRLENVSMTGKGVELLCGATGQPMLRDVTVSSGTTKLAAGVTFNGSCGAVLQRVDVSGATVAALDVLAASTTAPVTVSGSRFRSSGVGVQVAGAKVVLQDDGATHSEITDNGGIGVHVFGTDVVDVALANVLVARNGGTGIVVEGVPTSSSFTMNGCDVGLNGAVSPTSYGTRTAGGLLFSPQGLLGTFVMQGNLVHGNYGPGNDADEIAFATGTNWPLSTGSCTSPPPNAIGCVGTGYSVSILSPGTVNAQRTVWPGAASATNGFVDIANACAPSWSATCP